MKTRVSCSSPRWISLMTKMHRRNHCAKLLICILLVAAALLAGCQKKEPLPQPEFPMSEEALAAALEETGLSWSIEQADEHTDGNDTSISYYLYRSESGVAYNSVSITSYDTEELGRVLHIDFREPQNQQWWQDEKTACWEDWRETLVLVARLYGGFEDTKEIFRACSRTELPQDENILWEGTLTGGYFRMVTENPMKPKRLSMGNWVSFNVYESEDAYLKFEQKAEKVREEWFDLQTASGRTGPQKMAIEFLARYFESANNGGLLLHEYNSGLFEPTQSIVTAMKYLDWITLINYFLDYDIARDMGYYSSMQDVSITTEGDITIVKGYCKTTAYETIFEIQLQKNEAGNYIITGLDFPDSKEYINFVKAFKKSTGELDAQASPYIDEQYNRILKACISEKKLTDEQIAVAVAKWHVKIHADWGVKYDIDNPTTSYLTDGSGLNIFNLSGTDTITTDSSMWLVSFNTDARPAYPTYCIDAKTFECIGYIPGA